MNLEQVKAILSECPVCLGTLLLNLELNGYIKLDNKQQPTLETAHLLKEKKIEKVASVDSWIDDWRALFTKVLAPHNLSMGIGNRQTCLLRMEMFTNQVSSNKDLIYQATKAYLADCIKHNRLSKLPQYFILPQDSGSLSSRDIKTGELYDYYCNILNNHEHYKDISYDVI